MSKKVMVLLLIFLLAGCGVVWANEGLAIFAGDEADDEAVDETGGETGDETGGRPGMKTGKRRVMIPAKNPAMKAETNPQTNPAVKKAKKKTEAPALGSEHAREHWEWAKSGEKGPRLGPAHAGALGMGSVRTERPPPWAAAKGRGMGMKKKWTRITAAI